MLVIMEVSPDAELNSQSTINYQSFDFSPLTDGSKPDDSKISKDIPLHQVASGCPQFRDQEDINANKAKISSSGKALVYFYVASVTCVIGVTAALMLQVYLGKNLLFVEGVLVSDHKRCTALGQGVLRDQGSSVDAAISATLCLCVVHPHVLGIGGGGVMLVHDIRRNKTKVLNFQGTAPKMLTEQMLQNGFEQKAGLLVGVPGMLRGLYQAHRMYGSLPWNEVVARAAKVAKGGFNVSKSLAGALAKVKGERLMARFKNLFFPKGRALLPGSFLRMPNLAQVLHSDLSNFYSGNLSQEMEEEVRGQGGVLSSEDISNYSVVVGQPLEGLYKKFRILVPAPPSAGAALLFTLKLLEGFQLHENNTSENQTALGWTSEVVLQAVKSLKAAVTMARGLGDPKYNSSVTELLSDILSTLGSPPEDHTLQKAELTVGQVAVMGPDDLIVSVAGSLSRPFGSRIVTRSGIILNSLILDFSWPNKTQGQLKTKGRNRIQTCKSPLSALIPTIVVPTWHICGTYMALVVSGGHSLMTITQVVLRFLVYENDISLNGPDAQSQFPEERVELVNATGHRVQRLKTFVHGVLRNNDVIKKLTVPLLLK
ncbi:glutathione hydrolase 7-like isoform X2 [Festucalex cinctus]